MNIKQIADNYSINDEHLRIVLKNHGVRIDDVYRPLDADEISIVEQVISDRKLHKSRKLKQETLSPLSIIIIVVLLAVGFLIAFYNDKIDDFSNKQNNSTNTLKTNLQADDVYKTVTDEDLPKSNAEKKCNFLWEFDGAIWSFSLDIKDNDYEKYARVSRDHYGVNNYVGYATEPSDDEYIKELTNIFINKAKDAGYKELGTAQLMASFVQGFEYTDDMATTGYPEYPKFPIETLYDMNGDCEDTSILLASMLHEMGYKTSLVLFYDHIGVGVAGLPVPSGDYYEFEGEKYFYIETTSMHWPIGSVPDEYLDKDGYIVPIE